MLCLEGTAPTEEEYCKLCTLLNRCERVKEKKRKVNIYYKMYKFAVLRKKLKSQKIKVTA